MFYQPGPKARAEYRAFTKRGGPVMLQTEPLRLESTAGPIQPLLIDQEPPSPLVAELVAFRIAEHIAAGLVRDHGEDTIRLQIEILTFRLSGKKAEKIDDPAAWLVSAIKHPHQPPKGFTTAAERQRREEVRLAKEQVKAEAKRRERAEHDRDRQEQEAVNAYWASLTPEQQAELDAAMDAQADPATLAGEQGRHGKTFRLFRRRAYIRQLLGIPEPAEA